MQRRVGVERGGAPPGIFETIATSLSALLERPLLFAIPITLDLYLWGGVRLSPAALTEPLARWLDEQGGADAEWMVDALGRLGATGDMMALIGWLVPTLVAAVDSDDLFELWSRPDVVPSNAWLVLALIPLLLLVAVGLGMVFGVTLAGVVRDRTLRPASLIRAAVLAAIRYVAFVALVVAVIAAVVVPAAIGSAIFLAVGVNVLPLLGTALALPAVVAAICLAFVGEAIILAEVGPLRAAYLSFGVVRRNVWPTIGMLAVLVIVTASLPRLFAAVTGTAPGLAVAVLGNAFVATGLALARMQFFYDRLRQWRADAIPTVVPAS